MKAINQKIARGVVWNLSSLLLTRGSNTIFLLVLARLLVPESFGLVAMVMVVVELAGVLTNSGLGAALVRSKEVDNIDLTTVFLVNFGVSIAAYGLVFFCAPFLADFYNQAELTSLIQVIGLVIIVDASKVVLLAILHRNMNFKADMQANSIATLCAGILAVTVAYSGLGVWSLVVQVLSQSFLSAIVLWKITSWRPGWQFSLQSFRRLFKFGKNLLAESLLDVAFQHSYVLVIGRYFGAELTGLYFFARKISNLVSQQLTSAVQQATFPALAMIQDDKIQLKLKYRQIIQLTIFIIAPIMMLIAVLAPSIVSLFFNASWIPAVPFLQVLAIVGLMYPIHSLNINLLNVLGRSDLVLKLGIFKKLFGLLLLVAAIPYGIIGIVISQLIGTFLALFPNTYFSSRLISYNWAEQTSDVLRPIAAATIGALASMCCQYFLSETIAATFISGAAGIAMYLIFSVIIRVEGVSLFYISLSRIFER
ncbi:MAG: lipopolysaccharide biosynthesis protein [Oceanospirillaceae bacterium]|nr:lipopolysaccharide biosynthesis protein [Oceanospirillaceae bacterium]